MRFHKLQNVQIALDFLKHRQVGHIQRSLYPGQVSKILPRPETSLCFCFCLFLSPQVKLVNIRNDDIADGNPKLTLGLIWTIILHFQVSTSVSVLFHFLLSLPYLSLGSVSCGFPPPWSKSLEWNQLFVTILKMTHTN